MRTVASWILVAPIRIYQLLLSPLKPPTCRFYPTCSQYGIDAIRELGPMRGLLAALRRVLKCHPFRPGGFDPVRKEPGSATESAAAESPRRHAGRA